MLRKIIDRQKSGKAMEETGASHSAEESREINLYIYILHVYVDI